MTSYDDEFDLFVGATWPRLRQAAFALTGHTADAEDLLQGVLARAYAVWPRVRRDDPVAYVRRGLVVMSSQVVQSGDGCGLADC